MRKSRPYLLLALIILFWGTNFVVARLLSGFDPIRVSGILYAFFRYFFGAITMIVVIILQRRSVTDLREEAAPYTRMLLLSSLFSAIFVMAINSSAEYIPSGTTSIIVNLNPIVVLIFGVLFLNESINRRKIVGFLLGFSAGLAFLWSTLILSPGFELGVLLAVIGLLAWGAYTITLHYLEGADPYMVMTVKHVTSSLMIIPFILILLWNGAQLILVWDIWTVLGLTFAGVIASGLAYILYFTAIEILGAPRASSFLFLVPFVSLAGDFVLGEPPHMIALIAGIVAIIGVALVKFSSDDKEQDKVQS